jgi:hypothetical protein
MKFMQDLLKSRHENETVCVVGDSMTIHPDRLKIAVEAAVNIVGHGYKCKTSDRAQKLLCALFDAETEKQSADSGEE